MALSRLLGRVAARELVDPSATRALRATVAFMLPLVLASLGLITGTQAVLASFAGHAVGGLDVKGAYSLRLFLLVGLSLVFAGAAWLGVGAGRSVLLAVLATGLIALGAGAWRHGLGEYGPSVASTAALLFFLGLISREGATPPAAAAATLAGCGFSIVAHAAFWPFLAQHPLRRTVAAVWLALANLAEALPAVEVADAPARHARVVACENDLRAALDLSKEALKGANAKSSRPLVRELEALNQAAAQLANYLMALNPSIERLMEPPGPGALAASFRSFLASAVNSTRSLALAVVSHQAGHLARFEVRLRRLGGLLRVLQSRVAAKVQDSPERAHLSDVLGKLQEHLPTLRATLRASMERVRERGPISFELFDLRAWSLRPLASALNFSLQVDPALVRFTFRLAVIMMAGTWAWRAWNLPHGFWIPLCVMVVLQPDYGATRLRATQRVVGTLAGGVVGSLLLWLHLPLGILLAATAAVCWAFTWYVKRNYAVAVFYITLLVVLQFEAAGPVTLALTLQRLAFTLAGCLLALLAALSFWPVWERDRFPPLLAGALRANALFFERLCQGLGGDPDLTPALVLKAKRKAQRANSLVFSSLNRMAGDPDVMREGIERNAALANHNLRITRWLSVAAVHFRAGGPPIPGLEPLARAAGQALEAMAAVAEGADPAALAGPREALEAAELPGLPEPRTAYVTSQLDLAGTELSAMLIEF